MADSSYAELLKKVDLFAGVERVTLAQIAAHLEPVNLDDGEVLIQQGDPGDALYVVAEGALEVVVSTQGEAQETRLNALTRGQFVGEMALITGEPRSATVRSLGPARVLRLGRDHFLDLMGKEPSVAQSVISVLSQRLRAADRARQLGDMAIRGAVGSVLNTLAPDQGLRLMQASLLPTPSGAALEVVFGEHADEVGANLSKLVVSGTDAPVLLRALREQLEREVSQEQVAGFLSVAADRLAEHGLWEDALAVASETPDQGALAITLHRALRSEPPFDEGRAMPWIERLRDEEIAAHPEIATVAARIYAERGHRAAARELLSRALDVATASGDAPGAQRLAEGLSDLSTVPDESSLAAERRAVRRPALQPLPLGPAAVLGLAAAAGCVVVAATVARGNPQWVFALLLGAALALWNSDVLPDFAVSLALVGAWMLWGVARAEDAVAGFATMDWVFVLAVLGIAVAVARSGLLFRAGLLLVQHSPASLVPQALALMLTGLLLSPLLPEPRGRAALTAPLALAVAEACRLRDREPAAALLGLAAWIGSGPLMFLFLNASPVCLLAWGLLPADDRARFDWLSWFLVALPLGLVVAAGTFGALFLLLRPSLQGLPSHERLSLQLAVLGSLSHREQAIIVVLVLTVVGWFLAPVVGVHVGVVAVLGFFAATATGSFDQQSFREMDWSFLIYYGVALSLQKLSISVGLGGAVAQWVGAAFSGGGGLVLVVHPLAFVAVVAVAGFLARLVLEASQAVLLLSLFFFPAAAVVGVSPWLVAIALLATNNPWLTERQTPAYQLAYVGSAGRLYSHAQARAAALVYAGVTLAGLLVLTPYWRLIGLL